MTQDILYPLDDKRIWVAGHTGLVGASLVRALQDRGIEPLTVPRGQLDLRRQTETQDWINAHKPDVIILAAATVGGIAANMARPAEFIYDNLMIEANVIHGAYMAGVEKMLCLGSSCIYPKDALNPITEDMLLSGALEPSNAPYALAKIAGIELCQSYRRQYGCDFITAMPCNLYGPGDNFDVQGGHVIPALMRRAHAAKLSGEKALEVWGTGTPRREFLYASDLARGLLTLLEHYSGADPVNIGAGIDITIADLAAAIAAAVGFDGDLVFDATKPDGVHQKLLDSSVMRGLRWAPQVGLAQGLQETYRWFLDEYA